MIDQSGPVAPFLSENKKTAPLALCPAGRRLSKKSKPSQAKRLANRLF